MIVFLTMVPVPVLVLWILNLWAWLHSILSLVSKLIVLSFSQNRESSKQGKQNNNFIILKKENSSRLTYDSSDQDDLNLFPSISLQKMQKENGRSFVKVEWSPALVLMLSFVCHLPIFLSCGYKKTCRTTQEEYERDQTRESEKRERSFRPNATGTVERKHPHHTSHTHSITQRTL